MRDRPTTALVLVRGRGNRLRPLTYTRPRHVLPIMNRPHIGHVFDWLRANGIRRIALLAYSARPFVSSVVEAREQGLDVLVRQESDLLGTAGALRAAEPLLDDGDVVVMNGDVLTDADLDDAFELHEGGADLTMLLKARDSGSGLGVARLAENRRVIDFVEKPEEDGSGHALVNAGVYILRRSVIDRIPRGAVWSTERDLIPDLIADGGRVFGSPIDGYWAHVNSVSEYLACNLDAIDGTYVPTASAQALEGIAQNAVVALQAAIERSCLGPGCVVEEGALVEDSVLLGGAVVHAGARVVGAVLGAGATVTGGCHVEGGALADGALVTGGTNDISLGAAVQATA